MKIRKDSRPAETKPSPGDPHITPKKVEEFKKGNINFDFLQPEGESRTEETLPFQSERRAGTREGKRGLFNRGRKVRPMGPLSLLGWGALVVLCVGGIVASFWIVAPLLKLLLLPVLFLGALGGLVMLALIQARPG